MALRIYDMLTRDKRAFEPVTPGEAAPEYLAPEKELTLALISAAGRTATINGQIYREGDAVQGETIVEIGREGVVLQKQDKTRRVLRLRTSSVTVTV